MHNCKEQCKCDHDYDCIPYEQTIHVDTLAQAYVPWQKFCSLFGATEGLLNGTIFPELYKPYHPKRCKHYNKEG